MTEPKNISITGFQVRPEYLTAVCGTCGALLGDIDQHDRWHGDRDTSLDPEPTAPCPACSGVLVHMLDCPNREGRDHCSTDSERDTPT